MLWREEPAGFLHRAHPEKMTRACLAQLASSCPGLAQKCAPSKTLRLLDAFHGQAGAHPCQLRSMGLCMGRS